MKRLAAALCALVLTFSAAPVYGAAITEQTASENVIDYITTMKRDPSRTEGAAITGEYPYVVAGVKNSFTLNNEIQKQMDHIASEARSSKASSITFSYETKLGGQEDQYASIILYSTTVSASSLDRIDCIVIDQNTMEIVRINDILGDNGVKLVNSVINHTIQNDPDEYLSTFAGIEEDQDFYVDGDTMYLAFDKYEISPGVKGIQTIPMSLRKIHNLELKRTDYWLNPQYSVRMVPLRLVCEEFGYTEIRWYHESQRVSLTKNNVTIYVELEVNRYTRPNGTTLSLEAAPYMRNGTVYVPVTYVESVLGLSYHIGDSGLITISAYIFD